MSKPPIHPDNRTAIVKAIELLCYWARGKWLIEHGDQQE